MRRALVKIDATSVLAAVDRLNLRGHARVTPVVGFPLRSLQQKRDVASFATSAPLAAVTALVEVLAADPLAKVVEALGDAADSPDYEQLAGALDRLLIEGTTDDEVVAVLAYAIGEGFPAAVHCRRLLEERPGWALPEVEVVPPPTLLAPRERDEALLAQRRARRAERKKTPSPRPVHRPRGPKTPDAPRDRAVRAPVTPRDVAPLPARRRLALTPAEADRFDQDHPLVGAVVMLEMPFDAVDPGKPEQRSKERPALVVAASSDGLLVRGIFSNPSTTRSLFAPWRRVGLSHPSFLDVARVGVVVDEQSAVVRLGRVSDEEWNATL